MLKVRARNSHSELLLRIASEVKRTSEYHALAKVDKPIISSDTS